MFSLDIKSKFLTQELFQLERCGRYDDALQKLGGIWEDRSTSPKVKGFSTQDAAEVILRCGSIFGFLGHLKQIPNSQEKSKDLITEAHQMFLELYDVEKIAECENHLALCYWRKGEYLDAEVWLNQAFSHNLEHSSDTRLYSHLVQSILTNENNKYKETISNFELVESDYRKYGDSFLNGTISSNVGIAFRNIGNLSEALKYFKLAKFYHRESQHQIYLGTTENNIALLYKSLQKFIKAHQAIDNATLVFKEINDRTRYGFSYDTKALIYIDECKYDQALSIVDEGIDILRNSENVNYLVETLSTKIQILVKLNKIAEASLCLSEAIEIARVKIGSEKANKLAEIFAKALNETKTPVITKIYTEKEFKDENIELVLPPELSHFDEIEGVWIKNKHLESIGLKTDSLAIILKGEVQRGDLVAVLERDSEDVICGFYDIDFGIICLEALDRKPQLFDENEIQILGRIVGVANVQQEDEKKMYVEPIEVFR